MSATKERRHIRHDKAQAIEDSPGDTDSFEPGAAFIHRPSGTGEVHEQQGYRSSDDGGDSGDGKDLGVYILHDLFGLLIFDEPTKGIDVGAKFEIYKLMNQLSDAGLGIILISSDLSEVIGMSDRVYVYREGHTVGELSHAEIEASNIMQYATGIKKQEGR